MRTENSINNYHNYIFPQSSDIISANSYIQESFCLTNSNPMIVSQAVENMFIDSMNSKSDSSLNFSDGEPSTRSMNPHIFYNLSKSLALGYQYTSLLKLLEHNAAPILFYYPVIKIGLLKLIIVQYVCSDEMEAAESAFNIFVKAMEDLKKANQDGTEFIEFFISNSDIISNSFYIKELKLMEYSKKIMCILNHAMLSLGYFTYNIQESMASTEVLTEEVRLLCNLEIELAYILVSYKVTDCNLLTFDEFFEANKYKLAALSEKEMSSAIRAYFQKSSCIPISLEIDISTASESLSNKSNTLSEKINKDKNVLTKRKRKISTSDSDLIGSDSSQLKSIIASKALTFNIINKVHEFGQNRCITKKSKNLKFLKMREYCFGKIKRENIDKRTMRKFRKYLILLEKQDDQIEFSPKTKLFINNLLFPPLNFESISLKSFNSTYMVWMFSDEEFATLYNNYIQNEADILVSYFMTEYKVSNISNLKRYLIDIPLIYMEHQSKTINEVVKLNLENENQLIQSRFSSHNAKLELIPVQSKDIINPQKYREGDHNNKTLCDVNLKGYINRNVK